MVQVTAMESISPTNLHNGKRHQLKVKGAKLLFDFIKICAEIVQHILGYSFCTQHHILAQCCQKSLVNINHTFYYLMLAENYELLLVQNDSMQRYVKATGLS
jgi:hypothetical protein